MAVFSLNPLKIQYNNGLEEKDKLKLYMFFYEIHEMMIALDDIDEETRELYSNMILTSMNFFLEKIEEVEKKFPFRIYIESYLEYLQNTILNYSKFFQEYKKNNPEISENEALENFEQATMNLMNHIIGTFTRVNMVRAIEDYRKEFKLESFLFPFEEEMKRDNTNLELIPTYQFRKLIDIVNEMQLSFPIKAKLLTTFQEFLNIVMTGLMSLENNLEIRVKLYDSLLESMNQNLSEPIIFSSLRRKWNKTVITVLEEETKKGNFHCMNTLSEPVNMAFKKLSKKDKKFYEISYPYELVAIGDTTIDTEFVQQRDQRLMEEFHLTKDQMEQRFRSIIFQITQEIANASSNLEEEEEDTIVSYQKKIGPIQNNGGTLLQ